jgi:hypothetical protein
MERTKSHHLIVRLITPFTIWAMSKLLETQRVKDTLHEIDSRAFVAKRNTMRGVKRAGRNALHNSAWLAGGAAAILIGAGLIGKATRD